MQNLGQLPITAGINGRFLAPTTGLQALIIGNESGLSVVVTLEGTGTSKSLYPGTVDVFPIKGGFTGNVLVTPTIQITTAILYPGSFLSFDAIGLNESLNYGAYPIALPRPMTSGTQSGAKGYSTFAQLTGGAGATGPQGLNLFNPKGSGVVGKIYSMQLLASDTPTNPSVESGSIYTRTDGIDNGTDTTGGAFWTAQGTFTHNIGGTPSVMSANILLNSPVPPKNVVQQGFYVKTALYDFLGPPDTIYLNPGQNILFVLTSAIYDQMFVLKWME